jgi:hypothetical protein
MSTDSRIVVKTCYNHIGGKLGNLLLEQFVEKGWIKKEPSAKHFYLTQTGKTEFEKLGIGLTTLPLK